MPKTVDIRPFVAAPEMPIAEFMMIGSPNLTMAENRMHIIAMIRMIDIVGVCNVDTLRLAQEDATDDPVQEIVGYQRLQQQLRVEDISRRILDVDINLLLAAWGDLYVNCRGLSISDVPSPADGSRGISLPAAPGGLYIINSGHRMIGLQDVMMTPEGREHLGDVLVPVHLMFYDDPSDEQMLFKVLQQSSKRIDPNDLLCGEELSFNRWYSGQHTIKAIRQAVWDHYSEWPVSTNSLRETADRLMNAAIISAMEANPDGLLHGMVSRVKHHEGRHKLSEISSPLQRANAGTIFKQKHLIAPSGEDSLSAEQYAQIIDRFLWGMLDVWPRTRIMLSDLKNFKMMMSLLSQVSFMVCGGHRRDGRSVMPRDILSVTSEDHSEFLREATNPLWSWDAPENRTLIDKAAQDFGRDACVRFFQDWAFEVLNDAGRIPRDKLTMV